LLERDTGRGGEIEREQEGGECGKEIEERKVTQKKKATSDYEPLCCTAMPLITLCGRYSEQRSCIDNPKTK